MQANEVILFLDLGAVLGWAAGVPGQRPSWGAVNFTLTRSPYDDHLPQRRREDKNWPPAGRVFARQRLWLEETIVKFDPKLICFESPYIPRPVRKVRLANGALFGSVERKAIPPNLATLRRLLGYPAIVDEVADRLGVPCREVAIADVCQFLTGKGGWGGREAKKQQTQRMCALYGFQTATFDESDALAGLLFCEATLFPAIAQRRGVGPLFIPSR